MKKILSLFLILVTAPSYITAQIPTAGLVGYWPFNGNANDVSATGNNGIVNGASLISDRLGNPNSAFHFDGLNNKITIPSNVAYDNQTYSISFWCRFSTPPTSGSGGQNVNPGIISRVGTSNTVTYDNWIVYEAVSLVGLGTGVSGSSGVSGTPTGQNNGQWNQITFTIGADSIRCYVNGNKTSSSAKGTNLTFGSYDIVLGRSSSSYWKAFQGDLDNLAIWNRKLSDQEVLAVYNSCSSPIITAIGNTTFCLGSDVLLSVDQTLSSYQWQRNNVNVSGANGKNLTAKTSGTYRCIVSSACGVDTSNSISITALPNAANTVQITGATTFCIGDSVTLNSSNTTAGYSYQWYRNNIAINGATSSTFVGKNPGTYKVVTKNNSNGCSRISSNSAVVAVTCRTSNRDAFVGNVEPVKDLLLYPNPNEGSFTIEINNGNIEDGEAHYQVMNINGQMVYSGSAQVSNGQMKTDINLDRHYTKGLYLVKIQVNETEMTEKVLLQ